MSRAPVELAKPGPGDELIQHLDPVLAELSSLTAENQPADDVTAARVTHATQLLRLFDAQAGSRWLDVAARRLHDHEVDRPHSSIVSAGHEANAAIALALRPDDPAFLDDHCGGFTLARSAQRRRTDVLTSGLTPGLRVMAHELVHGSSKPAVASPSSDSASASRLPRALGVAWALGRRHHLPQRVQIPSQWPDDAVAVVSFSDAHANHSIATGAVNAGCWAAYNGVRLPLLLICEDTGGSEWIEQMFRRRAGLEYRRLERDDPAGWLRGAQAAVDVVRDRQVPLLLHLRCVRIGGHSDPDAGSDAETGDPLAATLRSLVRAGVLSAEQVTARWSEIRDEVEACVLEAMLTPSASDKRAAPSDVRATTPVPAAAPAPVERLAVMAGRLPEDEGPLTLAQTINRTLLDAAARLPGLVILGEHVAASGALNSVTAGLRQRLGRARVYDTVLDEQTVLAMAWGAGMSGLFPVAEMRGEAAAMRLFSEPGQRNPLIARIPCAGDDCDNVLTLLRDSPGVVVACAAHPCDAAPMLRTCIAAAELDGSVCVLLEPIELYHERDMLTEDDGAWLAPYLPPAAWPMGHVPIGRAATWGTGDDLTIVTFGGGVRTSLRAAATLRGQGVGVRVIDLRWLAPLPMDDVLRAARITGRCLIFDQHDQHVGRDQCSGRSGISERLITGLLEGGYTGRLARVTAQDSLLDSAALLGATPPSGDYPSRGRWP